MSPPDRHITPLHLALERVDPDHPARGDVEAFIAAVYRERYDARLDAFLPHLLAFRDPDGRIDAAIGVRCGEEGPLFVERYLDQPADVALARRLGTVRVDRSEFAEVGNFAARSPGDARRVIVRMTALLHAAGRRWVLFAATRQLQNAFERLRLDVFPLAPATPDRIGASAPTWGSYYETDPVLMWGDVAAGAARLGGRELPARRSARCGAPT